MKRIIFTLLVLCASATAFAQNKGQHAEYLDWKTAKINGAAGMETPVEKLYSTLGKPDSIVKPNMDNVCSSFYNKAFKYVYIKGSCFELYGKTAVASSLRFKSAGLKVKSGAITLDENTTLASLSKYFPKAAKAAYPLNTMEDGKVTAVNLPAEKAIADAGWLLFFKDGKLIKLIYHINC